MRIDKFLKVSRILKRRTVACSACESSKVEVNGKIAKPSHQLKIGDIVKLTLGGNSLVFKVIDLNERANKEESKNLYEIIE